MLMRSLFQLLFLMALGAPVISQAHPRGLYDTQQQAEQRARQLGCAGTHQNNGKWMPCRTEAELHTGRLGPINLQPCYSGILGTLTLIAMASGIGLLVRPARRPPLGRFA
jgi:hypothetical protein